MKLKIFSFLFVLTLSLDAQHIQKISNVAQIEFPGEPEVKDTLNVKMLSFVTTDCIYGATRETLDGRTSYSSLENAYTEYLQSFTKAGGGKILSTKDITIGVFKGKEIEIDYALLSRYNHCILRVVYMNSAFYCHYLMVSDKEVIRENAPDFFATFTILENAGKVDQKIPVAESKAYRIGYLAGKLIIPMILAGIVVVVIVIIKKRKEKASKIS